MDSRGKEVQRAISKQQGCDDKWSGAMVAYYNYLADGGCDNPDHMHAFKIYENSFEREVIESLLLSEADPVDVESAFGIQPQVLDVYHELFFDTDRFASRLAKISYVENYEDQFGRELKLRALHLGPDFVLFRFGNHLPESQNQQALVKKFFMASAYRAMEANFNPLGSGITKVAVDHAKLMLKAYDALKELFSSNDNGQDTLIKVLTLNDVVKPKISNAKIDKKDIT